MLSRRQVADPMLLLSSLPPGWWGVVAPASPVAGPAAGAPSTVSAPAAVVATLHQEEVHHGVVALVANLGQAVMVNRKEKDYYDDSDDEYIYKALREGKEF